MGASRHGFTLIELSIVLVIIGLIVGGVLVGRDLIRAAELREVVTTAEKVQTAINAFRLKYNCLPGDCARGTSFGFATNGNGNKRYDAGTPENYTFWRMLAEAGLYEGSYTGVQGPAGYADCTPGVNCPKLKIKGNGGVTMLASHAYVVDPTIGWALMNDNYLFLGADSLGVANSWPLDAFLNGREAWQIDLKVDDGLPATGNYISTTYAGAYAHTCEEDAPGSGTSVTTATAVGYYRVSVTTPICSFSIKLK